MKNKFVRLGHVSAYTFPVASCNARNLRRCNKCNKFFSISKARMEEFGLYICYHCKPESKYENKIQKS